MCAKHVASRTTLQHDSNLCPNDFTEMRCDQHTAPIECQHVKANYNLDPSRSANEDIKCECKRPAPSKIVSFKMDAPGQRAHNHLQLKDLQLCKNQGRKMCLARVQMIDGMTRRDIVLFVAELNKLMRQGSNPL